MPQTPNPRNSDGLGPAVAEVGTSPKSRTKTCLRRNPEAPKPHRKEGRLPVGVVFVVFRGFRMLKCPGSGNLRFRLCVGWQSRCLEYGL